MIRLARNLVILAGLSFFGMQGSLAKAQDVSLDDVIAIGAVRVVQTEGPLASKRVILHDEQRGDLELILTPTLIDTIDEYPADSFEVEGLITNGQMTVKNLRPIE